MADDHVIREDLLDSKRPGALAPLQIAAGKQPRVERSGALKHGTSRDQVGGRSEVESRNKAVLIQVVRYAVPLKQVVPRRSSSVGRVLTRDFHMSGDHCELLGCPDLSDGPRQPVMPRNAVRISECHDVSPRFTYTAVASRVGTRLVFAQHADLQRASGGKLDQLVGAIVDDEEFELFAG